MRHPARSPILQRGIHGKANAASRRPTFLGSTASMGEAAG
jgi:hypothetical protein